MYFFSPVSSFQRDRKPLQPLEGRVPARSEFDIREHRNAGLTKNASVCLHAEAPLISGASSYSSSAYFFLRLNLLKISYTIGTMTNVRSVELVKPPITVTPSPFDTI